jgi:hypothetical protein
MDDALRRPVTRAVSLALQDECDPRTWADLLFLEAWEMRRPRDLGATLRASQIRRANPALAAAIELELQAAKSATAIASRAGKSIKPVLVSSVP